MKQCFKISVLSLLYCCAAVADDQSNTARPDMWHVYTESPEYVFDAQVRALFFKPSANNLYYAVEAIPFNPTIAVPIASPRWAIFDFHPDYNVGFDIGFVGVFQSRCSNVALNWEHFSSSTCASHKAGATNMVGPFSSIGPDAGAYKQVEARVVFDFDEINMQYGQYINFGCYLSTHLFAGIGVTRLKQCMTTVFSDSDSISRTFLVPTSFTGAGPQCGVDFAYDIVKGLRVTGQLAATLLVGTMKNHSTYLSVSPIIEDLGNPSPNVQGTTVQCRTQMVPSFIERLGLAYHFAFCERYEAQVGVGFEAKILLNAIQTTDLSSGVVGVLPVDNTVGVFARTYERNLGNFALHGAYVEFDMAL